MPRDSFRASCITVQVHFGRHCLFPAGTDPVPFFIFFFPAPRTSRELSYVSQSVCRVGTHPPRAHKNVARIGHASVCVFDSSVGWALESSTIAVGFVLQAVCSSLSSLLEAVKLAVH